MNEISILTYLLSRRRSPYEFGATKEEIVEILNPGKTVEDFLFNEIIINFSDYVEPLGLQVKYNPLNSYWYLAYKHNLTEIFNANPFNEHPSLAASLFCTIACCLKSQGPSSLKEIRKLRKKKSLLDDLRSLERLGYLKIDRKSSRVSLTPLIGYQIDIHELYRKIHLKMNKE